jgi:hypothetical protein
MTKAKISEYDAVAANNTDVNGVNIDEGCAPSGMNNMGREIMAALKRFETGADGDSLTVGGNLIVSGTVTAANTATLGNVDVNGGTIDGAVIGGSTPAAGSFTTLNTSGAVVFNDAGADVDFRVEGDTDANLLFVDASTDRVGIGTNAPALTLHVLSNNDPALFEATAANKKLLIRETSDSNSNAGIYIQKKHSTLHPAGHWYGDIYFQGWDGSAFRAGALIEAVAEGTPAASSMPGQLRFSTNGGAVDATERARITSGGQFLVGKTADDDTSVGCNLTPVGLGVFVRSDGDCVRVNRTTSDGDLVTFKQDGTQEGSISVSGSTVSYNGGHLSRWAQMLTKPELFKGTVMSNLDEMNVYIAPTTYWTEEDELPVDEEGNPTVAVGDVKVETHQVENEQLNKVKVSDVDGDANVAGVFVNWTYDEAHQVDEINMAMTGDMIIRIAEGVTVARGDLLMSAGDGTAKPQGDDIVRSKTIAKVTSTHVTCTYEDGSYCVPCVLMAC